MKFIVNRGKVGSRRNRKEEENQPTFAKNCTQHAPAPLMKTLDPLSTYSSVAASYTALVDRDAASEPLPVQYIE